MASTSSHAAPSRTTTCSAKLRIEGNALYNQASHGGFGPTIQRAKLARAKQLYNQALHLSSSPDERASCCKNLGMLNWLWCKVELNEQLVRTQHNSRLNPLSTAHVAVCKFYLLEALRFLLQAKEHGGKAKPQLWIDQLDRVLISVVEWATEKSSLLSISHSPLLQYLCEAFDKASPVTSPAGILAYKNHAEALFKEGLTQKISDDTMDYKACLSFLHDCSVPLRKASAYPAGTQEDMKSLRQEVQGLQESVYVQQCICQAMQAITLGDEVLSEALTEEEGIDMEGVKDSLDHYRGASLATRELDMETEGIAMSRIGKVYSEVLKLHEAAHKYHFQAARLALTVMSPSIARAEWYKYSLEKVQVHQEKVAAEEREEHEKNREPILQKLKPKLAMLSKEAVKSAESFLKYLYTEHPHPDLNRNVVPILGTKEKVKASLKKAILHYHPDSNASFGAEWKVMCEEICKHLNLKYTCFK